MKRKAKSRLKQYKAKKRLRRSVILSSLLVLILWGLVFYSIDLLDENNKNAKVVVITKTIIKEVEAQEQDYLIGKMTAYSCGNLKTDAEILINCPSLFYGEPKTANGTTPIPYKTMACDEANMGKVFEVDGIGQLKCTDKGGAIKGKGRFDLYVETVEEAREWGIKQVNYKLVE